MIQSQQKLYEESFRQESSILRSATVGDQALALKLVQNGKKLLSLLNLGIDSLETLCYKTVEDTFLTINECETSRLRCAVYGEEHVGTYEALKVCVADKVRLLEVHQRGVVCRTTEYYDYGLLKYYTTCHEDISTCVSVPFAEGLPDLADQFFIYSLQTLTVFIRKECP